MFGYGKYLVAGIGTSDANQKVVLRGYMANYIAFTLTAVLPANNNIYKISAVTGIEPEKSYGTDKDGMFRTPISRDDNIRDVGQLLDIVLDPIPFYVVIRNR